MINTMFVIACVPSYVLCLWLQDLSSSRSTGSGSGHTLSKLFGFGSKSSKTPPPVPRKVPSLPKVHGAAPIPLIPDGNGSESDDDEDVSMDTC